MAIILESGVEGRLAAGAPGTEFFLYLFAGLPLKRVARDGNRSPRDQRRNLFYMFTRFIGRVEKSTPAPACPALFFPRGRKNPAEARTRTAQGLSVVGREEMTDVLRDDVLERDEVGGQVPMARGCRLAQDCDRGDEENEEKEKNGPGKNDGKDQRARRDAPAPGWRGGQGRRGRGIHWDSVVEMRRW